MVTKRRSVRNRVDYHVAISTRPSAPVRDKLAVARRVAAIIAATGCVLLVGACGLKDDVVNLSEAGLGSEGAAEFENIGVQVDGDLDCTLTEKPGVTDENGEPAYSLNCTGTTVDGREVTLEGDTEQATYVGFVDGDEVWRKDCIGSDC